MKICFKKWKNSKKLKKHIFFVFQMKQIPVKEETDPDPLPHLMILTLLADYCRQFLLDFIKVNDTAICCTKVKCA